MRPLGSIALNTFREAIRDRLLYVIVVFGLLLLGASVVLGTISLDQDVKIIKDLGLAGIFIFNFLVILSVGTNLVSKEVDKKSIYAVLTKPIGRGTFVVGKFLGLALTLLVTTAIMGAVFGGLLLLKGQVVNGLVIGAIGFSYLELLFLVALALVFSTFAAPVSSAVYTLAFFLIGHSMTTLTRFADGQAVVTKWLVIVISYVLPNLEKFNLKNQVVYNVGLTGAQLGWTILYGVAYITALLILASSILKRKEF